MSWTFLRREWGAVSFVVAVIVGVIAVPVALVFHNDSNSGVTLKPVPTVSATASGARTSTPTPASGTSTPTPGG